MNRALQERAIRALRGWLIEQLGERTGVTHLEHVSCDAMRSIDRFAITVPIGEMETLFGLWSMRGITRDDDRSILIERVVPEGSTLPRGGVAMRQVVLRWREAR